MAGAGALLGAGAGVVVRLKKRVPRAEAISVKVTLHDQLRFFLLEGVARLAQKTDKRTVEQYRQCWMRVVW